MTILTKSSPFIIALFVVAGCASTPSPQAEAISRSRPFMVALQAYHHKFGDYPMQLDELRPLYLAADLPAFNNSDTRHVWALIYKRVGPDDYELYVSSTPCSQAVIKDGMFVAGYGPNYK